MQVPAEGFYVLLELVPPIPQEQGRLGRGTLIFQVGICSECQIQLFG